ncbi:hypothetical protein V5F77_20290 [Xanthobacter sp. DSM 24535]|uniref:hypothetical protein n=1 Tax=Roseixanthobacter psychrophilus TaxID=3119917 RepID=UPI003729FAEB
MTEAWMQTETSRVGDLMTPHAGMVDFVTDIPNHLARLPRFNGATGGGPYSVAQHCVLGVDAILAETGSIVVARAFLLHDAHESYCGDLITPVQWAIAIRAGRALAKMMNGGPTVERVGKALVRDAIAGLKHDLDSAIYEAAGEPWPLPPEVSKRVHDWDLRMLAAERAQLLCPSPHPWHPDFETIEPAHLRGRISIWPWPRAAAEWRARFTQLFPQHIAARAAA